MPSLFRRNPRTVISPLFREVFAELASEDPDREAGEAITLAAAACGMADPDLLGIARRLQEMGEKAAAEKPQGTRTVKGGSGFGKAFSAWLGSLSTDRLCLWLADYDIARAGELYRKVDIDDLTVMVDLKVEERWQTMRSRYEACLLGFGGKLGTSDEATTHTVDMSDKQSVDNMISDLKKFGF